MKILNYWKVIKTEIKPEPLINKKYISGYLDEEDMTPATKEEIQRFKSCVSKNPILVYKEDDIKLACEFYLKYVNRPEVLLKNKHYSWLFNRTLPMFVGKTYGWWHYKYVLSDDVEDRYIAMDLYNQWLFKLAFKDIFEELK